MTSNLSNKIYESLILNTLYFSHIKNTAELVTPPFAHKSEIFAFKLVPDKQQRALGAGS